jgi:hypothetical protein
MAAEVPAGIEGDAGGEAGDKELGGRGGRILTAHVDRLVDPERVAADLDVEAVAASMVDAHGGGQGGG